LINAINKKIIFFMNINIKKNTGKELIL